MANIYNYLIPKVCTICTIKLLLYSPYVVLYYIYIYIIIIIIISILHILHWHWLSMTYKGNILHKYYILLHTNVIILHKLPLRLRLILDKYSVWVIYRFYSKYTKYKKESFLTLPLTRWQVCLNFLPFCQVGRLIINKHIICLYGAFFHFTPFR